jgi:hypothetical protein
MNLRTKLAALVSLLMASIGAVLAVAAPAQASPCGTCYYYAGGYQTVNNTGVSALVDVANPTISGSDYHSLMELTVQNSTGTNIVEVGWNKDPGLYSDSNTHIFVSRWASGTWGGYNSGGFVNVAGCTVCAGTSIQGDVGTIPNFAIQHLASPSSGWWVGYKSNWIGYFPDSVWSGGFTTAAYLDVFGEVAVSDTASCTDMGDGTLATSSVGARINTTKYITTGGVSTDTSLTTYADVPLKWNSASQTARSIRVGGPGWC